MASGNIPKQFIDEILLRTDLVELINARVPLKKTGINFSARCPFHQEKTPSFSVNPQKQFYYCFGCGAGGNALNFLTQHDRLSFVEAVEELARLAGLEVPRDGNQENPEATQQHQALYDIQAKTAEFYQRALLEHPQADKARAFLRERGLNLSTIKHFEIGFAPAEWQNLPPELDQTLLKESGLIIEKDQGRQYDRFRNRIMFPIRDKRGRIIGFGGRVLDDSTPKYLNSPETPIFQKRFELYGLHQTLQNNDRLKHLLIVEGYMDVISLFQHGITTATATLGTASSREQFELLFRYCKELVLCFDGDKAGNNAAWRALNNALPTLKSERQIKIMRLPSGDDPDSLIRQSGKEDFQQRIAEASPLSEFFFEYLSEQHPINSLEGKSSLARTAKPLINSIPEENFRELMFNRLAELTQIRNQPHSRHASQTRYHSHARLPIQTQLATIDTIILLLAHNPQLISLLHQHPTDWRALEHQHTATLQLLYECIDNNPDSTFLSLMENLSEHALFPEFKAIVSKQLILPEEGIEAELSDAIQRLNNETRHQRLTLLTNKAATESLNAQEKQELKQLLLTKS